MTTITEIKIYSKDKSFLEMFDQEISYDPATTIANLHIFDASLKNHSGYIEMLYGYDPRQLNPENVTALFSTKGFLSVTIKAPKHMRNAFEGSLQMAYPQIEKCVISWVDDRECGFSIGENIEIFDSPISREDVRHLEATYKAFDTILSDYADENNLPEHDDFYDDDDEERDCDF